MNSSLAMKKALKLFLPTGTQLELLCKETFFPRLQEEPDTVGILIEACAGPLLSGSVPDDHLFIFGFADSLSDVIRFLR